MLSQKQNILKISSLNFMYVISTKAVAYDMLGTARHAFMLYVIITHMKSIFTKVFPNVT